MRMRVRVRVDVRRGGLSPTGEIRLGIGSSSRGAVPAWRRVRRAERHRLRIPTTLSLLPRRRERRASRDMTVPVYLRRRVIRREHTLTLSLLLKLMRLRVQRPHGHFIPSTARRKDGALRRLYRHNRSLRANASAFAYICVHTQIRYSLLLIAFSEFTITLRVSISIR